MAAFLAHTAYRIPHTAYRIPHTAYRIPHTAHPHTPEDVAYPRGRVPAPSLGSKVRSRRGAPPGVQDG
eukprot:scaffold1355_cov268-Pinguiococcus_pyrenoidosus.AAC.56